MARFYVWREMTLFLSLTFVRCAEGGATELTFKLEASGRECFFEEIAGNVSSVLEYQAVSGGQLDVDVTLTTPSGDVLYRANTRQYDLYSFTPAISGEYAVCFTNENSSFAEKSVYLRLHVGPEPELPGYDDHVKVIAMILTEMEEIHARLNDVIGYQTGYRLREPLAKRVVEELTYTVWWLSLVESVLIVLVEVARVLALRTYLSVLPTAAGQV